MKHQFQIIRICKFINVNIQPTKCTQKDISNQHQVRKTMVHPLAGQTTYIYLQCSERPGKPMRNTPPTLKPAKTTIRNLLPMEVTHFDTRLVKQGWIHGYPSRVQVSRGSDESSGAGAETPKPPINAEKAECDQLMAPPQAS